MKIISVIQEAYQLRHISNAWFEEQDDLVKLEVTVDSNSLQYHEMLFEAKCFLTKKFISATLVKAGNDMFTVFEFSDVKGTCRL